MNRAALFRKLFRLAGQLFGVVAIYGLLRSTNLYQITAREMEGLNTLILLVGSIYAVMLAFLIFVIWGQFTEVENCAMRECNVLDEMLRFSQYFNADASHAILRALTDYIQLVVRSEWTALDDARRDSQTERAFAALRGAVVRTAPANAAEETIYERVLDIAVNAQKHRDERIVKSLARIPPTLMGLVNVMAGVLLLLVLVYPFHHWLAGGGAVFLVALVLGMANLVMTDTDNPFDGICNVKPDSFSDLLT